MHTDELCNEAWVCYLNSYATNQSASGEMSILQAGSQQGQQSWAKQFWWCCNNCCNPSTPSFCTVYKRSNFILGDNSLNITLKQFLILSLIFELKSDGAWICRLMIVLIFLTVRYHWIEGKKIFTCIYFVNLLIWG